MAGPTGGIVEYFAPGDRITCTVDETSGVAGGNVVYLKADRTVALCSATTPPFGVAIHDAADGAQVTVVRMGVWPLKAAGSVTVGEPVVAAAGGAVATDNSTPDSRFLVGIAVEAITDTEVGPVALRL